MSFKHDPLPRFELSSVTDDDGRRRYLLPDGTWAPSITTVLGATQDKTHLVAWRARVGEREADRVSEVARRRGTALHDLLERYLKNEPVDTSRLMPDLKAMFGKAATWLRENVDCVRLQEACLWSPSLGIAGRTDCVAEVGGKLAVVDFKNSRSDKDEDRVSGYRVQATAYCYMVEEVYRRRCDDYYILVMTEDGGLQIFEGEFTDHINTLRERINSYRSLAE